MEINPVLPFPGAFGGELAADFHAAYFSDHTTSPGRLSTAVSRSGMLEQLRPRSRLGPRRGQSLFHITERSACSFWNISFSFQP